MTFRKWMISYSRTEYGTLGRDLLEICQETKFPESDNYGEILNYLNSINVPITMLETFKLYWEKYKSQN